MDYRLGFSKAVIDTHIFVPKSEVMSLEQLKEMLTVESKYDGSTYPTYVETPKSIGLPLYYRDSRTNGPGNWPDNVDHKNIKDIRSEGSKIKFEFLTTLFPEQKRLITEFWGRYCNGFQGFTIEAPPGYGKTLVLIKMIQLIERSAVIVVPRLNLVEQWIDRITQHTDLSINQIGYVAGKKVEWQGKPIVVGLVHSLASQMDNNVPFQRSYGIAVFDEVDRSVPPTTFSPVLGMFPVKYRIGASATVKRKDGLHHIHNWHITQTHLTGEDVGRMDPKILTVNYHGNSGYVHAASKKLNRRGMLLSRLAKNAERNWLIVKYARLIYNSGRRVLILSDRTAQLATLRSMLKSYRIPLEEIGYYCDSVITEVNIIANVPCKVLVGKNKRKVSAEELRRSASACAIILGTYGKVGIGTDIPDLAGLIYGTPQADVRQTQGRIERMLVGKKQPVVVDIVDTYYEDARNWGYARLRYYRSKGLKVKER